MDIKARIEAAPMKRTQVGVIAICMALYMIDGFDVLVMAFSANAVMEDWGLSASQLGVLLSSALVGMAIGSIFVSSVADVIGRQKTLVIGASIVAVGMLVSAFAPGYGVLVVLRFITGLAVGTLQATANVLASEFSNAKRRSTALALVSIGQPIGGVLGGMATGVLITAFGWRSAFLFGAAITVVMIPFIWKAVPESVDFLLVRRPENALQRINKVLRRIDQPVVADLPALPEAPAKKKSRFADVLTGVNARRTILISLAYFILMASFYFANSWTPKLVTASGFSQQDGITAGVLFSVGAIIGAVVLGAFGARFPMRKVLAVFFVIGGLTFGAFSLSTGSLAGALFAAALVGFGSNAPIAGMLAISPTYYTSEVRGTALGLVIGMGRVGAIASPIIAGALMDGGWQPTDLYFLFIIPMLIGAVVISMLGKPVLASVAPKAEAAREQESAGKL
ncbi:MFS transporter [Arthrobacter sp. NPDC089319]|uniref:MFS transporter n=1 Tax=Arthrobacter sp. NPDC089319 TaxID=3155915 RepID=UPI003435D474